jgi:hypothetical protein
MWLMTGGSRGTLRRLVAYEEGHGSEEAWVTIKPVVVRRGNPQEGPSGTF